MKNKNNKQATSGKDVVSVVSSVLPYQRDFIEFALSEKVLEFSKTRKFKLKSGRYSPYFFNAGD